jgi:hypothetical protein
MIRNTLGAGLYRVGRYREAAETLRANLPDQKEEFLASDRYFLAMSHHQLAEMALALAYYTWVAKSVSAWGNRSQLYLLIDLTPVYSPRLGWLGRSLRRPGATGVRGSGASRTQPQPPR